MIQPGRNRVKNVGEPHDQPGSADDGDAPEHGEVVELLPVGPAVELGLGALAEEPLVVVHEIAPILQRGHHRVRPKQHLPEAFEARPARLRVTDLAPPAPGPAQKRGQVQAEVAESHDRAEAVQGAGGVRAAKDVEHRPRPVGVIELERHAGDDQQQEAGDYQEVQKRSNGRKRVNHSPPSWVLILASRNVLESCR